MNRPRNQSAHAPWGIHWFRRDLRIAGNDALAENVRRTQGRTLALFCFDAQFLSRNDFSHNRFAFFLKTLRSLKDELHQQGGDLLVVDGQPHDVFAKLIAYFKNHAPPNVISWNRDYEPFARARDAKVETLLKSLGIETLTARDHLLIEPHELSKNDAPGTFYQVYSPFARKWFDELATAPIQKRIQRQTRCDAYLRSLEQTTREKPFGLHWSDVTTSPDFPFGDALEHFESDNHRSVNIPIPDAGFRIAYQQMNAFAAKLASYNDKRDFPAHPGTSRLSMFFKNGSLVSSQVLAKLELENVGFKDKGGAAQFVKELAWREFYYHILFHRPEVESKSFLPQYEHLAWDNNETWFKRWCEGTTGFPIVDAGMRELNQTGFMHNRVRMIVASFLTKDLLIDWRWGENYFMKQLLDGDLAPNNGGWQWAASTGCDPQPYFRIFNPWLQAARFDPDATYIKTYLPELHDAPAKLIHDATSDRSPYQYPAPIVDHAAQKAKALSLYQSANKPR